MTDKELKEISNAIKVQVKFFDEIYNKSMPYVLWHAFPAKNYAQFWPLQRGEEKMKYLASVEQITGLFLVDVMPEYAAKQIRDFHQKNEI
jgi:UDPglucose--hexose-1-phosphate uridylyltransferase